MVFFQARKESNLRPVATIMFLLIAISSQEIVDIRSVLNLKSDSVGMVDNMSLCFWVKKTTSTVIKESFLEIQFSLKVEINRVNQHKVIITDDDKKSPIENIAKSLITDELKLSENYSVDYTYVCVLFSGQSIIAQNVRTPSFYFYLVKLSGKLDYSVIIESPVRGDAKLDGISLYFNQDSSIIQTTLFSASHGFLFDIPFENVYRLAEVNYKSNPANLFINEFNERGDVLRQSIYFNISNNEVDFKIKPASLAQLQDATKHPYGVINLYASNYGFLESFDKAIIFNQESKYSKEYIQSFIYFYLVYEIEGKAMITFPFYWTDFNEQVLKMHRTFEISINTPSAIPLYLLFWAISHPDLTSTSSELKRSDSVIQMKSNLLNEELNTNTSFWMYYIIKFEGNLITKVSAFETFSLKKSNSNEAALGNLIITVPHNLFSMITLLKGQPEDNDLDFNLINNSLRFFNARNSIVYLAAMKLLNLIDELSIREYENCKDYFLESSGPPVVLTSNSLYYNKLTYNFYYLMFGLSYHSPVFKQLKFEILDHSSNTLLSQSDVKKQSLLKSPIIKANEFIKLVFEVDGLITLNLYICPSSFINLIVEDSIYMKTLYQRSLNNIQTSVVLPNANSSDIQIFSIIKSCNQKSEVNKSMFLNFLPVELIQLSEQKPACSKCEISTTISKLAHLEEVAGNLIKLSLFKYNSLLPVQIQFSDNVYKGFSFSDSTAISQTYFVSGQTQEISFRADSSKFKMEKNSFEIQKQGKNFYSLNLNSAKINNNLLKKGSLYKITIRSDYLIAIQEMYAAQLLLDDFPTFTIIFSSLSDVQFKCQSIDYSKFDYNENLNLLISKTKELNQADMPSVMVQVLGYPVSFDYNLQILYGNKCNNFLIKTTTSHYNFKEPNESIQYYFKYYSFDTWILVGVHSSCTNVEVSVKYKSDSFKWIKLSRYFIEITNDLFEVRVKSANLELIIQKEYTSFYLPTSQHFNMLETLKIPINLIKQTQHMTVLQMIDQTSPFMHITLKISRLSSRFQNNLIEEGTCKHSLEIPKSFINGLMVPQPEIYGDCSEVRMIFAKELLSKVEIFQYFLFINNLAVQGNDILVVSNQIIKTFSFILNKSTYDDCEDQISLPSSTFPIITDPDVFKNEECYSQVVVESKKLKEIIYKALFKFSDLVITKQGKLAGSLCFIKDSFLNKEHSELVYRHYVVCNSDIDLPNIKLVRIGYVSLMNDYSQSSKSYTSSLDYFKDYSNFTYEMLFQKIISSEMPDFEYIAYLTYLPYDLNTSSDFTTQIYRLSTIINNTNTRRVLKLSLQAISNLISIKKLSLLQTADNIKALIVKSRFECEVTTEIYDFYSDDANCYSKKDLILNSQLESLYANIHKSANQLKSLLIGSRYLVMTTSFTLYIVDNSLVNTLESVICESDSPAYFVLFKTHPFLMNSSTKAYPIVSVRSKASGAKIKITFINANSLSKCVHLDINEMKWGYNQCETLFIGGENNSIICSCTGNLDIALETNPGILNTKLAGIVLRKFIFTQKISLIASKFWKFSVAMAILFSVLIISILRTNSSAKSLFWHQSLFTRYYEIVPEIESINYILRIKAMLDQITEVYIEESAKSFFQNFDPKSLIHVKLALELNLQVLIWQKKSVPQTLYLQAIENGIVNPKLKDIILGAPAEKAIKEVKPNKSTNELTKVKIEEYAKRVIASQSNLSANISFLKEVIITAENANFEDSLFDKYSLSSISTIIFKTKICKIKFYCIYRRKKIFKS